MIDWSAIPTELVGWLITVILTSMAVYVVPSGARNLGEPGAARMWRNVKRDWYFYCQSYTEPGRLAKGARIEIDGIWPVAVRARMRPFDQDGFLTLKEYTGQARVTGQHLCIVFRANDPAANWSLVFRFPPTSIKRGHVVGSMCSITLQGDPVAGAGILSTDPMPKSAVQAILNSFGHVVVDPERGGRQEY